jgi:protocatechuate 3,4-dioxygenase beta subunit
MSKIVMSRKAAELALHRDLARMEHMRQRRQMLSWLASGGAAAFLASCGGGGSEDSSTSTSSSTSSSSSSSSTSSSTSTTSSSTAACIEDPNETNGPYPSDGSNTANGSVSNILTASGIVRSDIRSSFGSSTRTAPGLELNIIVTLVNSNMSCAPLEGYAIYIWQCDSSGNYSIYGSGLSNENYLRGVQVTDANGQATFTTVFPGCYSGRYPHIHFEIYPGLASATSYKSSVLTAQMAMPSAVCSTIYNNVSTYSQSVKNFAQVTTSSDNVFNSSTAAQLAQQTPSLTGDATNGYSGNILIGVGV